MPRSSTHNGQRGRRKRRLEAHLDPELLANVQLLGTPRETASEAAAAIYAMLDARQDIPTGEHAARQVSMSGSRRTPNATCAGRISPEFWLRRSS